MLPCKAGAWQVLGGGRTAYGHAQRGPAPGLERPPGFAQPGIYRRTTYALGSRIEPVVIFVKQANYRKQFDFYGVTQREIDRNLAPEFNKAIAASIARMGAK